MTRTKKQEKKKTFYTDYLTASKWCNCQLILCNNISSIDDSIWDNMRFNMYNENDDPIEIYQYFLTSLSDSDVEFMEKTFDLHYTYSDLLDCYVLCVLHYGTAWDYVPCEVKSESWIEVNRDKEYNKD